MKDRHGNKIKVGWSDHQVLWVEAAMTLAPKDRLRAYREIADLIGYTLGTVRAQAHRCKLSAQAAERRHRLAAEAQEAGRRAVLCAEPIPAIRRLTPAELMSGRVVRPSVSGE